MGAIASAPVRIEAPGSHEEWDAFVAAHAHATWCHRMAWAEILRDVLGAEPRYRVARGADGVLTGVLPLARVRGPAGHFLMSLPFLNAGGPLGPPDTQAALAAAAVAEARATGAGLLELRCRHPIAADLTPVARKITVTLPLPEHAGELWSGFAAKLRSQVRRAQKAAFTVRFGADQCVPFHKVYARHMHELGTPALPLRWFTAVRDAFGAAVEIGVVYRNAAPVAAGVGLHWRDTFEMVWASALDAFRREAPNMLLYWASMERAIERGARVFDFGRCSPNGNTHRFKRQWGGRDEPLPWMQWRARVAAAAPAADRPLYQVGAAVWRRVPYVVASRLAPRVARWLP